MSNLIRKDLAAWLAKPTDNKDPADSAPQGEGPPGTLAVGTLEWKKKLFKAKEAERAQKEAKQIMNQVTGNLLQKYSSQFHGEQLKSMMHPTTLDHAREVGHAANNTI